MKKSLFKKSIFLNFLLALTSFLISLLAAELLLRHFFIKDLPENLFLFLSKPALHDQEKNFGFQENTTIREACIYWNGKNLQTEYDVTFVTNDIGLVQKRSFDPTKEAIVFVGDSFTQGNGATPWFYKLEENWHNNRYQLINLGIMGTGIEQWKDILHWFAELGNIEHIFICFISNDWERMRWVRRDDLELSGFKFIPWSQRNDTIHNQKLIIYYINKDITEDNLLNKAENIRNNKSIINLYSYNIFKKLIIDNKLYYNKSDDIFNNNKIAFEKILSDYGRKKISLFQIPQKGEVIQGSYSPVGQRAKEIITSQGLIYIDGLALCGLTENDYLPHDAHPNASGYDKIYKCLLKHGISTLRLQNNP